MLQRHIVSGKDTVLCVRRERNSQTRPSNTCLHKKQWKICAVEWTDAFCVNGPFQCSYFAMMKILICYKICIYDYVGSGRHLKTSRKNAAIYCVQGCSKHFFNILSKYGRLKLHLLCLEIYLLNNMFSHRSQ